MLAVTPGGLVVTDVEADDILVIDPAKMKIFGTKGM